MQRVDAGGVSGAEVTTQGDRNIVVSIPEIPTQEVRDAISKSSQLQFRPVLAVAAGTPQPGRDPVAERHRLRRARRRPTTPTTASSASPTSNSAVPGRPDGAHARRPVRLRLARRRARRPPAPRPPTPPTSRGSPPSVPQQFEDARLQRPGGPREHRRRPDQAAGHLRRRRQRRSTSSARSPSPVTRSATPPPATAATSRATVTSEVEIALTLNGERRQAVRRHQPQDGRAPRAAEPARRHPRLAGHRRAPLQRGASSTAAPASPAASPSTSARSLSDQLKFGALPLSFVEQTSIDISPTLGSEQLRYGLIAGLIGLLLVVVYSLLQYRALGFVTVASILVAGLITYLTITILGWSHNYRLDMAGRHRPDRRHRLHRRLVHRLLRAGP